VLSDPVQVPGGVGRAPGCCRAPFSRLARWVVALGPHAVAWRGRWECAAGAARLAAPVAGSDRDPLSSMSMGWRSPIRWGGGEAPIRSAGQPPPTLMDRPVVVSAQQGEIGQVGGAAIEPVNQMMTVAPGQGPGAVGEDTTAVADGEGVALSGGDDPAGPPDVQGLAGGAAQDRGEPVHGCLEPGGQAVLVAVIVAAGVVVMVLAVAADHHPGQGAVTGQPPTGLGMEGVDPAQRTPHRPGAGPAGCRGPRPRSVGVAPHRPWGAGRLRGCGGPVR
jgi:hypothetical protein